MAKKKKGKKSKGKKKDEKKKPKGPTEKELFEMQIEQLREHLESANRDLEHTQAMLEDAKGSMDSEVASKKACVAHLKRTLRSEYGRRLEIQERLQTERDLCELVERRALGKFNVSERNGDVAKSLFLQQKMELEGKLSLLEELRLARNSQRAHLRRVEESLRETMDISRNKTREKDKKQVEKLLQNRETFLQMSGDIRSEWRQAFQLRLPVQAKRQLEKNVKLREVCDRNTEELLKAQEDNRTLKRRQKFLELEEEIQSSAENTTKRRRKCQELRLSRLFQASPDRKVAVEREHLGQVLVDGLPKTKSEQEQSFSTLEKLTQVPSDLESAVAQEQPGASNQQDVQTLEKQQKLGQDENTEPSTDRNYQKRKIDPEKRQNSGDDQTGKSTTEGTRKTEKEIFDKKLMDFSSKEDAIGRRMERVKEREIELCGLEDRSHEMDAILKDQAEYRTCLEREMDANIERNGKMMSAILRAGRVTRARCGKLEREGMDFDLLHQIRMILDIERINAS